MKFLIVVVLLLVLMGSFIYLTAPRGTQTIINPEKFSIKSVDYVDENNNFVSEETFIEREETN